MLASLAKILDGPHAATRASLVLAVLLGTTVLLTVMALEPLGDCDKDLMRERLGRLFETARPRTEAGGRSGALIGAGNIDREITFFPRPIFVYHPRHDRR